MTAPATPGAADTQAFVVASGSYYEREFSRLQHSRRWVPSLNPAALLFGPLWAAARGAWTLFWIGAFAELVALTEVARALSGNLGADRLAQAAGLRAVAADRLADAVAARTAGDAAAAETFARIASNLHAAADSAVAQAAAAGLGGRHLLWIGACLFIAARLSQAVVANAVYERAYADWRSGRSRQRGLSYANAGVAGLGLVLAGSLTIYRFAGAAIPQALLHVPARRDLFTNLAGAIDRAFEWAYRHGNGFFDGVRDLIRATVHLFEVMLVEAPWPVVMGVLLVAAWRLAGRRVALFTAGSIAYLALMGLWEQSMQTVALLGTAALLCVAIGIPLGVWLARSARAHRIALPVLDLMQTMPALVYLIPAIAFFGTGSPPGIIATLIFGMPPVVRLTALGLSQVPADVREAARAFGATDWQLLTGVDLPLARPAIMAGVNQTVLMCLSMVVIASLIGAQGLGAVVLESLQFAASGQGLLAGLAILLCAIVIDRLVQRAFDRDGRSGAQAPSSGNR
jgi:glycine betaine/proline transport system permease protein